MTPPLRSCGKRGWRSTPLCCISAAGNLLRAVFGQRHSVGMRLRVCFGQKDRCGASARRKVELHGQLLLPRKRAGAGWTARVRFLCASADKLLRVKWAAGMRFAAYAAEGGAIFRAVLSVCAEKHLSDPAFVIIRGKFALIFPQREKSA